MDNMENNNINNINNTPAQSENLYRPAEYSAPAASAPRTKNSKLRLAALAVSFSLLGGALGTGGTFAAIKYIGTNPSAAQTKADAADTKAESSTESNTETGKAVIKTAESGEKAVAMQTVKTDGTQLSASEVYKNNVNSTVGITTEISSTNYFGYTTTAAASGSGFIITDDGYIVTNYHVIDGANKVKVTTYDNTSYDAEIVGSDESNDIAVLKIDAKGLEAVTLGDSEALSVGDNVVAIGNPLGELTFTLTSGVVSAMDRQITTSNSVMMNLIQTDCAINSGNSGGALFNMYGEVIGVTNAKYSSNSSTEASIDNIGFAIPINTVKDIVTSIIENGYVVKPYIGVSVETVSSDMKSYGIPEGAVVRQVNDDSPAKEAGIEVNDIVTKIDGKEIASSTDMVAAIRKCKKGDTITVTVYRQGETKEFSIVVDETKPEEETEDDQAQQQEQQQNNQGRGNYQYGYGDEFEGMDPFEFFGMR
ncbi:MAG: trypsin-like peptidase domain-containing protein [Ruminococcus sp.]|uniref:S1C family serine protease n=1 Tax=Ruminococcus sp. TaxID=41978 RepID=UPI0025D0ED8A|nr:trypsin-like peptidase domain-containing protein [Ruminococcus sp.]MBO4867224.1 trypsin-like peptidase domain-containing protein [Ruminococcus sp.]